jgi:hypothetical protein
MNFEIINIGNIFWACYCYLNCYLNTYIKAAKNYRLEDEGCTPIRNEKYNV